MYLSKKKHILSNSIMAVAIINILGELINVISRMLINNSASLTPQLLEKSTSAIHAVITLVQFVLTCFFFLKSFKQLNYYINLIPAEDRQEMAKLQKEELSAGISVLRIEQISQITKIWGAILIGVQIIYEVTSSAYQKFITQIMGLVSISDPVAYNAFVALYNSSHGFKYIGMLIAISIGIFATAVFLQDRALAILSIVLMVSFIISFAYIQNSTVEIASLSANIVWSSILFHIIQTMGLLSLALYLRKHYQGM